MTLEQAVQRVETCAAQMAAFYGRPVFDEWALVLLNGRDASVLAYIGPRREHFEKNFGRDAVALKAELFAGRYDPGDFEFASHASGTHFDAFIVAGRGVYLICNHINQSMESIKKDSRWLSAQVPFAELSDTFRADPVALPVLSPSQ